MASITFTTQTADGTTVNVTHVASFTDLELGRLLRVLGIQNPGLTTAQVLSVLAQVWVNDAIKIVQNYEQNNLPADAPTNAIPIGLTLTS
jgi:hypothetical protein